MAISLFKACETIPEKCTIFDSTSLRPFSVRGSNTKNYNMDLVHIKTLCILNIYLDMVKKKYCLHLNGFPFLPTTYLHLGDGDYVWHERDEVGHL